MSDMVQDLQIEDVIIRCVRLIILQLNTGMSSGKALLVVEFQCFIINVGIILSAYIVSEYLINLLTQI